MTVVSGWYTVEGASVIVLVANALVSILTGYEVRFFYQLVEAPDYMKWRSSTNSRYELKLDDMKLNLELNLIP